MLLLAASAREGFVDVIWNQGNPQSASFLENTACLRVTEPWVGESVLFIYHAACLEALLTLLTPVDASWQLHIRNGREYGAMSFRLRRKDQQQFEILSIP
jgi:hypothetical protein